MEVSTLEVVSVISAFVAVAFFVLGRWSAFRTMKRRAQAAKRLTLHLN